MKSLFEGLSIEVQWNFIDVVKTSNDVVYTVTLLFEERGESCEIERGDEVRFDSDGEGDLVGVKRSKTVSFVEIGIEDGIEICWGEIRLWEKRRKKEELEERRRRAPDEERASLTSSG